MVASQTECHSDASGLRVLHVIAGLDPAHGGPSYSVPRLCEALAAAGAEPTLVSVAGKAAAASASCSHGYRDLRFIWDHAQVPFLRSLRCSAGLSQAVYSSARKVDIVHNHGVWLMPNVMAGRAANRREKPFIVSTRGMLAPTALAFSTLKKRIFWATLQGASVRGASCLHATSDQEYSEVREFGLTNPVAIIPNGIDVPELPPTVPPNRDCLVLALGRIHPKKGLEVLIEAWARVSPTYPNWQLRIIGPAEAGHDQDLRSLARSRGLARLSVEGAIYGAAKATILSDADLFVLPTLNENFGIAVAEALAAGTPVISSKGAPWSGLETEGCGWWVDHGAEPLAAALSCAMAMPREALKAMGAKGRAWMVREFSWDRVAADMLGVYRWLVCENDPPPVVRFN